MSVVIIDPVSSGTTFLRAAQQPGVDLYVFSTDEGERRLTPALRARAKQIIKIDTADFAAQLAMLH